MREFSENPMSDSLKHQFRDQFERLVILDYVIRNTDRGTHRPTKPIKHRPVLKNILR